jgi:3-methyl-2-oxobutanoate hydroxymethyltransferase
VQALWGLRSSPLKFNKSVQFHPMPEKLTAPKIRAMKGNRRIVCVTAYDAPGASVADAANVDLILVGDSVGNTVLGFETTVPVTLEMMVHHTEAASRGCRSALLVADLPFGSYQSSVQQALDSSCKLLKAGAHGVKLEGDYPEIFEALRRAGIPAMGHVGMTPQSVHAFGGFRVQGKGDSGDAIGNIAARIDVAGAFAIVLELIPSELAKKITEAVSCPTIGIGAGVHCDGQIQVLHDIIGLSEGHFRHSKRYANVRTQMVKGLKRYASEVRERSFPGEENSF